MHILFLSHYFPPEVNAPASRTYEHSKRWVKETGVKVTVITNHPNHPNGVLYAGHKNRWLTRETVDGIEVLRVKTYLAANAGFARRTLNYLFFMLAATAVGICLRKPDVLIATSPQFFCAVAGFLISLVKGCPFIFELRDIWPESIITVGAMRPGLAIRLLEKVELFLYRQSFRVVALTQAFRINLIRRGIPAAKIRVIKNGADLSLYSPHPAPAELSRALKAKGKFVVAYIGTVGMAHAVEGIVAAAKDLQEVPDILFLIVGDGAQRQEICNLVERKGLSNVKVLGGVSKEKVLDYYALSDLNLVTLRDTPLFRTVIPSKIFEIMAMARPILCAVDGECRQVIEQSGSGVFVEPENVKQLVQTIKSLSGQRERLKVMGENGRRFVEQNADRDQLAKTYLTLLKDVATNSIPLHPRLSAARQQYLQPDKS